MKTGYINVRASEDTINTLKDLAAERKLSQGQLLDQMIHQEDSFRSTVNIRGDHMEFIITVTYLNRLGQENVLCQTADQIKAINSLNEYSWNFRSSIVDGLVRISMRTEWITKA